MLLLVLTFFAIAACHDIKNLEVPLWVFPTAGAVRLLYLLAFERKGMGEYLIATLVVFLVMFLFTFFGLGGADALAGAVLGLSLGFSGLLAVFYGFCYCLPYTAYMHLTGKEHEYPFIPYLCAGFLTVILTALIKGDTIIWIV